MLYLVIPSCTLNPCLHNGTCSEVNIVNYKCDCSLTHYKGRVCEIGILETPSIPLLITDVATHYLSISAYPDTELIVNIISSSNHLNITPSTIHLYSSYPQSFFFLKADKEGIYTISYNLTGMNAENFEIPPPVRVVVVNNLYSSILEATNKTTLDIDILSSGCCTPGGLIYQCPYSTHTVTFSSTCSWYSDSNGNQVTDGVVFASSHGLTLPVSISGTELMGLLSNNLSNTLPHTEQSCFDCSNNNPNCTFYNFTAADTVNLLTRRLLGVSYLNYSDHLMPTWLSLFIIPLNLSTDSTFDTHDFTTFLSPGVNVSNIDGCEGLEVDSNGLYSVLRYADTIIARVMTEEEIYQSSNENDIICIAVNLCQGNHSPVHISISDNSQQIIKNLNYIQVRERESEREDIHPLNSTF